MTQPLSKIPQADAASELLRRKQARRNLAPFIEYVRPGWRAANIHKQICGELEAVQRREIDRLLIQVCPQHGKSTTSSIGFPAWSLGQQMKQDVAVISATESLAVEFGREVRNTVAGTECRAIFPQLSLAADSQAAGRWHTDEGGSFLSLGIGGQFFGRGADLAIIDDPFSSWEDAQSELERKRVWDWYDGTFYNRVRPKGAIVVIQHRLHENDLIGQLLHHSAKGHGADRWRVVNLKASPDLWPERYTAEAYARIRANMHPLKWAALYEQQPLPDEGSFFKRDWFQFFDPHAMPECHFYTSGDFAVTDDGGDYTEIATHGYSNGVLYLGAEGWSGRTTADVWIEELISQAARRRSFAFFGEGGPIRRAIEPFLLRRMRERSQYVRLEWLTRGHDKPTMARSLQGMAAMGKVKIADTAYGHRLLAQLLQFPLAQIDDGVDMAALMAMAIDQAHPAVVLPPTPKQAPRGPRTYEEFIKHAERNVGEVQRIR